MAVNATLVVQFGDGADSSALVLIELDETLNGDKTTFAAGDIVHFIVHHSPVLKVGNIAWTDGQVVGLGPVKRTKKIDMTFVDKEPQELSYIPSGPITAVWQGRQSTYKLTGNQMTVDDPPVVGEVTFEISALSYQLISPATMIMDSDNSYSIVVVFTMDPA